ncbi:unnamed protein product [Pelagomonas calceolata]|uniref:Uncharacterized protein n=3 Tax=Pelagomonas calceolata TaxID=35677 RepID=A0A8J2SHH1_9STRA|nr:unnamed protein product [Pelagomonas calceolata]
MSDEEDAVEALLDELAEAPPDDALDAAAERLAEDALAAACAEQLADAAARDVVNEAVIDAAAACIVENAIKTAGNEIDAADEALAASATELLIEHAIIDAAAETDDQDDRTSSDTVARVQTEVATTIIEGAIDTLKDDDTLKEAFMEAVDERAAMIASHAIEAARDQLAADAQMAHEAEVAERAARESERAAGFSLLSSQLADLGSLMSGILGRTDADVAAAFPEPETVAADDGNAPELDAPSPAGDLATRLADLDETVSSMGAKDADEDLPKDLVEQEQALAGLRARLEHARLEGARLRALAETSPPATAEPHNDEDASDGDAAPSHADLARLVDEAREALEGTRTAPSDLTQPQPAAPLFGGSAEPPPPPTPVAGSAATLFAPALPQGPEVLGRFDRLKSQLSDLGDSVANLADGRRPPATAPAAVLVPAAQPPEPAPPIEQPPVAAAPRPPPASYGFAAREPGFLAPRRVEGAPAILSPAGTTRLGGFRGPEAPEYAASPHSVAGDYFAGDYAHDAAAPESEVYLPTPAGPATYREAPAEPTFEAPAEPPVTWHAQPLILPPPPTAPATPQPLQYTVPAPPPGHVAIPGLDLVDDTRPGMPRFGYAYDDRNAAPDAPPEFIRDADDI